MTVVYQRGIYLPEIDLWLDPQVPRPVAVVSHAHSDHLQSHAVTLATPATVALMRHRLGREGRCRPLPFGRRTEFPGFAVTLYPAGHVLGSAQALIEVDGRRLLYSGDFKLKPGRSMEGAEVPEAEGVIMETTFGKPGYVFPPTQEVIDPGAAGPAADLVNDFLGGGENLAGLAKPRLHDDPPRFRPPSPLPPAAPPQPE